MGDERIKNKFCFPVRKLESDRFKLIPFMAEIHAQLAYDQGATDPSAYAHVYRGPFSSVDEFVEKIIRVLEETECAFAYAIIDKTKPSSAEDPDGAMVGMISFTEGNVEARAVEIGAVRIFPSHQGTGVATLATRMLLDYAFAAPEEGGLGLLRVEWHSSTENPASITVAQKLGFEAIGTVKYESCFVGRKARGKVGNGRSLPPYCKADDVFRDFVMYAIYWDSRAPGGAKN
ncbi:acetyltransferase [Ilyonectria sp. MPI-CAGE-AT-0026]|nr:acetyltransferase [Ilyonectria sp. MPI-CAGE-AT-0026]